MIAALTGSILLLFSRSNSIITLNQALSNVNYRAPGIVVEARIADHEIRFFVHNQNDVIQKEHLEGRFYEPEELAMISRFVNAESRCLDIGANVGNHVIYLCKCLGVRELTAIEPTPAARILLLLNLRLNDLLEQVDTSYLGVGLSDRVTTANASVPQNNLGGSRLVESSDGDLKLTTGDQLLGQEHYDFIKIDVEGMEIEVLRGMQQLIDRCRPTMFIEVDTQNQSAFQAWLEANSYAVAESYRRYIENDNKLIVPR